MLRVRGKKNGEERIIPSYGVRGKKWRKENI